MSYGGVILFRNEKNSGEREVFQEVAYSTVVKISELNPGSPIPALYPWVTTCPFPRVL